MGRDQSRRQSRAGKPSASNLPRHVIEHIGQVLRKVGAVLECHQNGRGEVSLRSGEEPGKAVHPCLPRPRQQLSLLGS
jgi:hypothetical protein